MFDGICILLALFLYYKAEEGYRNIAFFVLCFFVVSDTIYHYFFLDFRGSNNWVIYQFYSAINIAIMIKIKPMHGSLFIRRVLLANVLLNIAVSFWFISITNDKLIYTIYPYPAGFLMLLCLFYLWMVGYGIRLGNGKVNHTGFICSLLRHCLCGWSGDRLENRVQTSGLKR